MLGFATDLSGCCLNRPTLPKGGCHRAARPRNSPVNVGCHDFYHFRRKKLDSFPKTRFVSIRAILGRCRGTNRRISQVIHRSANGKVGKAHGGRVTLHEDSPGPSATAGVARMPRTCSRLAARSESVNPTISASGQSVPASAARWSGGARQAEAPLATR
jgi:hypothetical protein